MEPDPALLARALAEHPAGPPWQILADWLDEHGEPSRAAFLRHHVRVAEGPADVREVVRARRALETLEITHGRRWRRRPEPVDGRWGPWDHGFVGTVEVTRISALYDQADLIFGDPPVHTVVLRPREASPETFVPRDLPPLRTLHLVGRGYYQFFELSEAEQDALRRLVEGCEELVIEAWNAEDDAYLDVLEDVQPERLRVLRVRGHHTVGTLYALMVVRAGLALETLDLGTEFIDYDSGYFDDPTLGEDGARLLAEASTLAGLRHLDLDLQRLGDRGLERIVDQFRALETLSVRRMDLEVLPVFPDGTPIRTLNLGTNGLGGGGLAFLAQARMAELRNLDLSTNDLIADDLGDLVSAPSWATLRTLDLSQNGLRNGGERLATAPPPPHLHTLRLDHAELGPDDVRALLATRWVRTLDTLTLGGNVVSDALRSLADAHIEVLGLSTTALHDADVIGARDALRACETLDLSHNEVSGAVGPLLADAPALVSLNLRGVLLGRWSPATGAGAPRLQRLVLAATGLGDDGLEALLASELGARLVDLDVSRCGLTARAVDLLLAWPGLAQVHRLVLTDNPDLDEDAVRRLAKALDAPNPGIQVPGRTWSVSDETRAVLTAKIGPDWDVRPGEED
ncbi:MAG: TIGR02996 domain-containing protein [Myxococcota bacterium]